METNSQRFEPLHGDSGSSPLELIRDALISAQEGRLYFQDTSSQQFRTGVLASLKLDGDEPDGLTLMQRITSGVTIPPQQQFWMVHGLINKIDLLIDATTRGTANPVQESLAYDLGAVAVRQAKREGQICPVASNFILRAPDRFINDPEIKAQIRADMQNRDPLLALLDIIESRSSEQSDLAIEPPDFDQFISDLVGQMLREFDEGQNEDKKV